MDERDSERAERDAVHSLQESAAGGAGVEDGETSPSTALPSRRVSEASLYAEDVLTDEELFDVMLALDDLPRMIQSPGHDESQEHDSGCSASTMSLGTRMRRTTLDLPTIPEADTDDSMHDMELMRPETAAMVVSSDEEEEETSSSASSSGSSASSSSSVFAGASAASPSERRAEPGATRDLPQLISKKAPYVIVINPDGEAAKLGVDREEVDKQQAELEEARETARGESERRVARMQRRHRRQADNLSDLLLAYGTGREVDTELESAIRLYLDLGNVTRQASTRRTVQNVPAAGAVGARRRPPRPQSNVPLMPGLLQMREHAAVMQLLRPSEMATEPVPPPPPPQSPEEILSEYRSLVRRAWLAKLLALLTIGLQVLWLTWDGTVLWWRCVLVIWPLTGLYGAHLYSLPYLRLFMGYFPLEMLFLVEIINLWIDGRLPVYGKIYCILDPPFAIAAVFYIKSVCMHIPHEGMVKYRHIMGAPNSSSVGAAAGSGETPTATPASPV